MVELFVNPCVLIKILWLKVLTSNTEKLLLYKEGDNFKTKLYRGRHTRKNSFRLLQGQCSVISSRAFLIVRNKSCLLRLQRRFLDF